MFFEAKFITQLSAGGAEAIWEKPPKEFAVPFCPLY